MHADEQAAPTAIRSTPSEGPQRRAATPGRTVR